MAKYTKEEMLQTVDAFVNTSYEKYESHSYAAGFLSSFLSRIAVDLPKHKQTEMLLVLQQQILDLSKE